ncbi:hypothetical protein RRG08_029153 [Elysia crispata]|uniref:Uncharacterized protein n=1 Tax=Elysia crispata TaxID=231223 RepID=A0AAE1CTI2_9GAST|nr:hypothetical protein RRG08_029153 [Elysia crispata]
MPNSKRFRVIFRPRPSGTPIFQAGCSTHDVGVWGAEIGNSLSGLFVARFRTFHLLSLVWGDSVSVWYPWRVRVVSSSSQQQLAPTGSRSVVVWYTGENRDEAIHPAQTTGRPALSEALSLQLVSAAFHCHFSSTFRGAHESRLESGRDSPLHSTERRKSVLRETETVCLKSQSPDSTARYCLIAMDAVHVAM